VKLSELRAGDEFLVAGTLRRSRFGGKIVKISSVNLTYEAEYQPSPTMKPKLVKLTAKKIDLVGGKVARDGVIEEIEA
jgi:hypothetical protein